MVFHAVHAVYIVGDSLSHVRGALPELMGIIRMEIGVYLVIMDGYNYMPVFRQLLGTLDANSVRKGYNKM